MNLFFRRVCLPGLFSVFFCLEVFAANTGAFEKIGIWENVVDFSINRSEDHLVMTLVTPEGRTLLYESFLSDNRWSEAEPVETINRYAGDTASVGGVFMTDNGQRLYFHANYSGGAGGFDIYYSDRLPDDWSVPQLLDNINTADDETFPAFIPGDETMYFLKHQKSNDPKIEKKEADRMSIYTSERDPRGVWKEPQPIDNVINAGYLQDIFVASDARTIYYTIRSERKEATQLMFARLLWSNSWLLPAPLVENVTGYDLFSPRCAGKRLYFVQSGNKKQMRQGHIVRMRMTDKESMPLTVVTEKGRIQTLGSHKPVEADVTVYNPTTLKILGRYRSNQWNGNYDMANVSDAQYIVDVRNPDYSFASYLLDYRKAAGPVMPDVIELFDTVQLSVSVYDSEIFRPLAGEVTAVSTTDRSTFRARAHADGKYLLALPLGSDYEITAKAAGFAEDEFLFKLGGDIVFSYFERNLPLEPLKRDMEVSIVDAETKMPVAAHVLFDNRNREETCHIAPAQMQGGHATVRLRDSDVYDMTVDGADGYAFHNGVIDLKKQTGNKIVVELVPLKINASLQLYNINFATGSSDIMPESYAELDHVVRLMRDNLELIIEISAHTDDVGSVSYNKILSERRAQSVVDYIVESGIPSRQLQSKGYGMSKPLVPNDSEENRARNRRVEFVVLETGQTQQ